MIFSRWLVLLCISGITALTALAAPELRTVPKVELPRYMGSWRVIACMDNSLERTFVDAVESYRLLPDGRIAAHFTWRSKSFEAPEKSHDFTGRVVRDETNARWKMRLFPLFTASYVIVELDPSYRYVAVAHPSRKFGWILARSRTIPEATYGKLVAALRAQGYDTGKLIRIPQAAKAAK